MTTTTTTTIQPNNQLGRQFRLELSMVKNSTSYVDKTAGGGSETVMWYRPPVNHSTTRQVSCGLPFRASSFDDF